MQIPSETRCTLRGNSSWYLRCNPYGIIDRVVGIIADSLEYLTSYLVTVREAREDLGLSLTIRHWDRSL
jgi:hypothetical protein